MAQSTDTQLVIGVGGSGKTFRLDNIAASWTGTVLAVRGDAALVEGSLLANSVGANKDVDTHALVEAVSKVVGSDGIVIADNANVLDDTSLSALRLLAASDITVIAAAPPNTSGQAFAQLADALTHDRPAQHMAMLDHEELSEAIRIWSGSVPATVYVDEVLELSGGSPGLARDVVIGGHIEGEELPQAVIDRIATRIGRLDPAVAGVAEAVALPGKLPDDTIAALAGTSVDDLGALMSALRTAGLLEPDDDRLVPLVAKCLVSSWNAPERRRRHRLVAEALSSAGTNTLVVAQHFRDGEVSGELAAETFRTAADDLRWTKPLEALDWYEQAVMAGAPPSATSIGRAEASLGADWADIRVLVDQFDRDDVHQRARARLILAALDIADVRPDRAARRLLETTHHAEQPPEVLHHLAVPLLISVGEFEDANRAIEDSKIDDLDSTARFASLVSHAATRSTQGANAVPGFIEAAEFVERTALATPMIVDAHTHAAAHAELVGDFAAAETVLTQALDRKTGGPMRMRSHTLSRAWVRFRQGRHDTGARLVQELSGIDLTPRDRLLVAALDAGLARRAGDIARLQDSWNRVEPALVRQTVDLTTFGPVGELILTAHRLGEHERGSAVQSQLDDLMSSAAAPNSWVVAAAWQRLQLAVVNEDIDAASGASASLELLGAQTTGGLSTFAGAVGAAAAAWANVLQNRVEPDAVSEAVDQLHRASLPWDGARLAGQAALRLDDPAASRALLERARDLKTPVPDPDAGSHADSPLSDREQEVAVLVVDGLTYKQIGAQLYISAKTVEHHVARIRRKLGAGSRQEMLAALREVI